MLAGCVVYSYRQYMQSDAVLKSSLVENVKDAMMSEQSNASKRRLALVKALPYVCCVGLVK